MMLCVLLKKSLYWGNRFCTCLVDLVAESLVSWMVMIDGGCREFAIRSCRHGIAVLSEEAFHIMACDSWLVRGTGLGGGNGL